MISMTRERLEPIKQNLKRTLNVIIAFTVSNPELVSHKRSSLVVSA